MMLILHPIIQARFSLGPPASIYSSIRMPNTRQNLGSVCITHAINGMSIINLTLGSIMSFRSEGNMKVKT